MGLTGQDWPLRGGRGNLCYLACQHLRVATVSGWAPSPSSEPRVAGGVFPHHIRLTLPGSPHLPH